MIPRVISMLLIGQLLVIFFGIMILGIGLRISDAQGMCMQGDHLQANFHTRLRDYGFWLSLLPLGWAVAAVRDARAADEGRENRSRRYELAGWLIFAGLLMFFVSVLFGFVGWVILVVVMSVFYYWLWRVL